MQDRRRDMDSVKRYAEWRSNLPNEGRPAGRFYQFGWMEGPVIELELGYRGAAYFLPASSSGTFHDLSMSK